MPRNSVMQVLCSRPSLIPWICGHVNVFNSPSHAAFSATCRRPTCARITVRSVRIRNVFYFQNVLTCIFLRRYFGVCFVCETCIVSFFVVIFSVVTLYHCVMTDEIWNCDAVSKYHRFWSQSVSNIIALHVERNVRVWYAYFIFWCARIRIIRVFSVRLYGSNMPWINNAPPTGLL